MPRILVNLLSYTGTKGGMETYTRELYKELGKLSGDFTYIGYASKELMNIDHSWFPGEVVASGITGENRFIWAMGELFAVARYARSINASLVHSPATLGPRKTAMPSVLTIHDMFYHKHPDLMNTSRYTRPVQWMEEMASRNASRILATSESLADDIHDHLGFARARIDVVPLAGTRGLSKAVSSASRLPGLLLTSGVRRKHKNFEGLLAAMALIPEDQRPQLVITGSHGDDPLIPIVESLGIGGCVTLKSWISQEELDRLFAEATAFIMPSFVDGFALPPLEAMSVGCPVILSGNEMMREIGGDVAQYFNAHDPQSIAETILATIGDQALLASMSEEGVKRSQTFTWKKVAIGTRKTFELALSEEGV